jgi:hypothetical protein
MTGLARAIRHSSFVILLGILCLVFPAKGFSQSSNRWLLVFNTSAAMRDRAGNVGALMQDLLTTAMHGNLRSGDTIGIWTYNDVLRADEAPLQTWDPRQARSVAQNTLEFLSHYRYGKTAAFGDVLTNMLRVIDLSDVITVILVSDGSDPINGTPFDARISAFYKTNYQAQRKEHMPIVTVFRGEGGRITTNTLSLAPWPVDIPMVPLPMVAKAPPPKPVVPAAKRPPPPPVPSLVMIGDKTETVMHPLADYPPNLVTPAPAVAPKVEAPAPAPEPKPVLEENPKPTETVAPAEAAPTVHPTEPVAETPESAEPKETANATLAATNWPAVRKTTALDQAAVETAIAPPPSAFSGRNIAVMSAAFAVVVCGLLILTARRARRQSQASLITRSLDREKK